MKKIAASFFGLALALATLTNVSFAHASGAGTIMLSSSSTAVSTGDTFTVSVWVDPAGESLDTVRVNLNFDPSILEGTTFDLASQFHSLSPGYSINNTTGLMTFGAFEFGDRVTTSGLFATATLKALSAGIATVSVGSDSKLINDGQEKVSASGFGSVMVPTTGESVVPTGSEMSSASLEEQGLVYFGAFAGRMPSSAVDWEALHCMAYDTCYPTDVAMRNVDHERISLEVFGAKYAHIPVTSMDWKALHAIAYTEIFYDWSSIDAGAAATTVVVAEPVAVVAEPVVVVEETPVVASTGSSWGDSIDANEAIGIFGALTARLPSSSADWAAVGYMQNGYVPATKDSAAESAAIAKYGAVYGRLPSSSADWNVIAAIAYSGAILN